MGTCLVLQPEPRRKAFSLGPLLAAGVAAAGAGLASTGPAVAASFDAGGGDVKITFDNTVKYSTGWRVGQRSSSVADSSIGPQANTNDGDMNFDRGLVSNRFDLLSELGVSFQQRYGFRVSAAAWYDSVYHQENDNPGDLGGALVNARSTAYNKFTRATRRLHGRDVELLDAFAYGGFELGEMDLNLKGGRFTQLYGESLFFGSNGVAAAQGPLDLIKALSVPNSRFQEILRPVGQVAGQLQITPDLTVGAYYQLEWRKSRLPGAGSYFSFADFVDGGGESVILGPGALVSRSGDIKPGHSGQGGVKLKYTLDDVDYGLYAARFHDKMPQFYLRPGVNVKSGYIGDYAQVFAKNINLIGASASTVIGGVNVAVEASFRDNMPLVASGNAVITNAAADGDSAAAYPIGRTAHFNISAINVFAASPLWDGASVIGEFAFNRRLSVDKNRSQLDPLATRDAGALQFIFTPEYFQVLPGVDLQVPIGFSYGLFGRSSVNGVLFPSENGGNVSIGVKADYQKTWQMALNYTRYVGGEGSIIKYGTAVPELSYKNFHGDRDFVSLTVQRTF